MSIIKIKKSMILENKICFMFVLWKKKFKTYSLRVFCGVLTNTIKLNSMINKIKKMEKICKLLKKNKERKGN